jgi:hypothetical protein
MQNVNRIGNKREPWNCSGAVDCNKSSPHATDRTLHALKDNLKADSKDIDDRTSLSLAGELGHEVVVRLPK